MRILVAIACGLWTACSHAGGGSRVVTGSTSTAVANSRATSEENRTAATKAQGVPGGAVAQVPLSPPGDSRVVVAPGIGEPLGGTGISVIGVVREGTPQPATRPSR